MSNNETSLTVKLAERSYDIVIGDNFLKDAGKRIKSLLPLPRVFVITDKAVAEYHLSTLEKSLEEAGVTSTSFVVEGGESTKSFAVLERLLNDILSHKPERKVTLIALGGGVVGDLTGFAASILLRGVNFIQIPTTLLAQVDSSVGGKTGINTRYGKNLVGSFYQPKAVLMDMKLLDSLPERELKAGYAEVVKYGLINDAEFFDWLSGCADKINKRDKAILTQAVLKSCKAKADVVTQDEREGGVRALLNLGHTFGHALEVEMGYDGRLLHGEAVAIGMVMAFQLSAQLGLSPAGDTEKVIAHLKAVGLPTSIFDVADNWDAEVLLNHMYQDKKVSGGKLVFILARGIGKSFIAKDIDAEDVRTLLQNLIKNK